VRYLIEIISFTLNLEQTKFVREEFYKFDRCCKGELDLWLFKVALHNVVNEIDIRDIFDVLDYEGRLSVTYHKFLAGAIGRHNFTESNLSAAFKLISGGKSYLTAYDISTLLGVTANLNKVKSCPYL
jgi:Ca2+-binding EF-hand superfamily protein